MKQIVFLLAAVFFVVLPFSCTEPTLIGSQLLEEDQASLNFTNELAVAATTIEGTPVPTHNESITFQLTRFLFGQIEDPVFGKSTASLYSQMSSGTDSLYIASAVTIDSVILSMGYDSVGVFGDVSQAFEVEVFRLEEDLQNATEYYSNQNFMTSAEPIGKSSFIPVFDSLSIIDYSGETPMIVKERPHVRIPLDLEFGEALFADPTIYQSEEAFAAAFKGFLVRPTNTTPGLASFSFVNTISRITVYYTSVFGDVKREYRYPFQFINARFSNFLHELEGSESGNAINVTMPDFLYLQGMQGQNIEVSFPDISTLGTSTIVNKAELELTVVATDTTALVGQIIPTKTDAGGRTIINDILSSFRGAGNTLLTSVTGGVPIIEEVNGTTVIKYRLNVSSHFQDIIDGTVENKITLSAGMEENRYYVRTLTKAETANRVVFYGPSHPTFAPKLNLTFTSL